ncbi:30S ribosomal protein S8 [bacterium]|nr:30S ribosomal protein S8 [bacterium]
MPDPISDMLTSIRNAVAVRQPTVLIPFSKLKYELLEILEKKGFIEKVEKRGRKAKKIIKITLKYSKDGESAISGLKRISKPGQRIYSPWNKIKRVKGGLGIAIISTSKGLMTDQEARKNKIGGEILCEVW